MRSLTLNMGDIRIVLNRDLFNNAHLVAEEFYTIHNRNLMVKNIS